MILSGKLKKEKPFITSRNVSAWTTGLFLISQGTACQEMESLSGFVLTRGHFNQLGHRGSRCGKRGRIVGPFLQLTVDSLFLFFHTTTSASAFTEELS